MFIKADLAQLHDHTSLLKYDDYEFEYACKYLLEANNIFQRVFVTRKGPKGGDGGVDLEMKSEMGDVICYGQCKQWRTSYKGLMSTIRELFGVMTIDGVDKGVLLVTREASESEKALAAKCRIDLIDARSLDAMIHNLHPAKQTKSLRVEAYVGTAAIQGNSKETSVVTLIWISFLALVVFYFFK